MCAMSADDALPRRVLPLLPLLAAVGETGQVTTAAAVLAVPQPSVSRGLSRLGTFLGTPVVEKHGRGIRLTAAGEALLPHARTVLAAATAGVEAVRERDAQAYGTLSLAFQNTLGDRVVPALITAFLAEHPKARFDLRQGSYGHCLAALDAGEAEIALISPYQDRTDLESVDLHSQPLLLLVPANHRLSTAGRIDLAEAADEAFIGLKPGFGLRSILDELATASGFTPTVAFEGDDLHTVRGLVAAGLGVALVPRDRAGAVAGVVEVPINGAAAHRRIGAVWQPGKPTALGGAMRRLLQRRGATLTAAAL